MNGQSSFLGRDELSSTPDGTPPRAQPPEATGPRVTVTLRPMAGPTSLGLFGLAVAALALSGLQLGWVPLHESSQVALVFVAFAFPAQLLTGVLSYFARDGATATAMSVLGMSWLVTGLVTMTGPSGARSETLGLFLVLAALAVGLTGITASLSRTLMTVVLLTASLRFLLTGIYQLTGGGAWKTVSGILGLLLVVIALYAAWASELEDALGETPLPTGRRGKGLVALRGSLDEQVKDISAEAGVRARL